MSVPINRDEKVLIALTHRHKIKNRCRSQATSLEISTFLILKFKKTLLGKRLHQQVFVSFLQRLDGQLNR